MASKLSLYNGALNVLGERKLASLSENRKSRRALDSVWDGGGVKTCLEKGFWNFAMRDIQITHSPSVTVQYGFVYAFDKPTDWCRTFMISPDETYAVELDNYEDQGEYWYANVDPLFVRYVSTDASFGGNLSAWTEKFSRYVENYFASEIAASITGSLETADSIQEKAEKKFLVDAQATDAMNETTRFPRRGTWSESRRGDGRRRDGGSRSNLIG